MLRSPDRPMAKEVLDEVECLGGPTLSRFPVRVVCMVTLADVARLTCAGPPEVSMIHGPICSQNDENLGDKHGHLRRRSYTYSVQQLVLDGADELRIDLRPQFRRSTCGHAVVNWCRRDTEILPPALSISLPCVVCRRQGHRSESRTRYTAVPAKGWAYRFLRCHVHVVVPHFQVLAGTW